MKEKRRLSIRAHHTSAAIAGVCDSAERRYSKSAFIDTGRGQVMRPIAVGMRHHFLFDAKEERAIGSYNEEEEKNLSLYGTETSKMKPKQLPK